MREKEEVRSGCDTVLARCLSSDRCSLVDINLEYKDHHTLYPLPWIQIYPSTPVCF